MKKILIVEDEFAYSQILEDELKKENYTVFTAKNGKIGLELAEKKQPDMILLDLRMPVMDGQTMLEKLRKTKYGSQAKVIMLTNLEPDSDFMNSDLLLSPNNYIVKSDLSMKELKVEIERMF